MRKRKERKVVLRVEQAPDSIYPSEVTTVQVKTVILVAEERSMKQIADLEDVKESGVCKRLATLRGTLGKQTSIGAYHKLVLEGIIQRFLGLS